MEDEVDSAPEERTSMPSTNPLMEVFICTIEVDVFSTAMAWTLAPSITCLLFSVMVSEAMPTSRVTSVIFLTVPFRLADILVKAWARVPTSSPVLTPTDWVKSPLLIRVATPAIRSMGATNSLTKKLETTTPMPIRTRVMMILIQISWPNRAAALSVDIPRRTRPIFTAWLDICPASDSSCESPNIPDSMMGATTS